MRAKKDGRPLAPKQVTDIEINPADCVTQNGQTMLLYDNCNREHRLIIFDTEQCLKLLERYTSWFIDGTFQKCPEHFYQLVTIHADCRDYNDDESRDDEAFESNTWVIPCLWALVSGKKTDHYEDLFSVVATLGYTLNPEYIMCDFESGLRSALEVFFPYCVVAGCYFHYCKAVKTRWFNRNKIEYMKTVADEDGNLVYSDSRILARRLIGLAFVPQNDVVDAFNKVIENVSDELFTKVADEIAYYEETWAKGKTIAGREVCARYPPPCWNARERTLKSMNRTNNQVESFHAALKHFIKGSKKPTIWAFIDHMKEFQSSVDNDIASMRLGVQPPKIPKKEVTNRKRIFNASKHYHNMDLFEYLDFVMEL